MSAEAKERIDAKVTALPADLDWTIGFWMADPFRHVEVKVQASNSREALLKAVAQVTLQGNERFHSMHMNTSDKYDNPDYDETLEAAAALDAKDDTVF